MNRRGLFKALGTLALLPAVVVAKQAEAAVSTPVTIDNEGHLKTEGKFLGIKITSRGNVGLGTSNPTSMLEIIHDDTQRELLEIK